MFHRDLNLARELSALADGEVDPSAEPELRRTLSQDPQARALLQRHQQVNAEARRVLRAAAPPPTAELRERLAALAPAAVEDRWRRPATPRWLGRFAAAAAILLAFGAGIFSGHFQRRSTPTASPLDVVPAAVVSHAEMLHSICSRLALGLHSAGYPAAVASLAPAVEQDLHSDHPYPDLRAIGYQYRGAGPCGWPLPDSAHLLYRSLRPGTVNAVSVFVQPWHGQYPLQADQLYTLSVSQSPFPMLAWRSEDVVYFLLADNLRTEQAALQLIRRPAVAATAP